MISYPQCMKKPVDEALEGFDCLSNVNDKKCEKGFSFTIWIKHIFAAPDFQLDDDINGIPDSESRYIVSTGISKQFPVYQALLFIRNNINNMYCF